MKDDYGLIESGLPPELVDRLLGANRRRKIADAMMASSMEPVQNYGPPGAKLSWAQGAAKMLDAYLASKDRSRADEESRAVATEAEAGRKAAMDAYQRTKVGVPGVTPLTPNDDEGNAMPSDPGVKADPRKALADAYANAYLAKSPFLKMEQSALDKADYREDQQKFLQEQRASQLEQRKWEVEQKLKDAALNREQKAELAKQHNELMVELKRMGAANDRPYFQAVPTTQGINSFNARTGEMKLISGPDGTPLVKPADSPTTQAAIAYGKKAGQESGDVDVKQHETAISASQNIPRIDDLIKQLRSSDAITGMGAEVLKNIERAKVLISNNEKAGKKVSDTEIMDAMMGAEVFPLIQSLGIGARGMDTPAEREFMRSVLTGTTALNKETLLKMAETRRNIAQRAIDRWNSRIDKGELDPYFTATNRTKERIAIPAAQKAVVRTGTLNGRKVIQYSDGTTEYGN